MKTNTVLGVMTCALVLSASLHTASAMYNPNQPANSNPQGIQILKANQDLPQDYAAGGLSFLLVINGKGFSPEESAVYVSEKQDEIMVPVRTIAEQLGYKLSWNQSNKSIELTKGPHFHMIKIGEDQYNIAKMNMTLGAAPELSEGTTYVPLSFFQKVIQANVTTSETGTIIISTEEANPNPEINAPEAVTGEGSITRLYRDDKGAQVGINGFGHGTVLNITDETEMVTTDGQTLTFSDLKLGMSIEAVYGPIMTASLPPITNTTKIVVKDSTDAQEVLGTSGEVTEVTTTADGHTQLTIKGEKLSDQSVEHITLTLTDDTSIIGTKDNQPIQVEELDKGTKVYGFYSPKMTKSLPPIGEAVKIVVEEE